MYEKRGIDIKKIFSVTIDGAPAIMEQHHEFVTLIEQNVWHPVMKLHCIFVQRFKIQLLMT